MWIIPYIKNILSEYNACLFMTKFTYVLSTYYSHEITITYNDSFLVEKTVLSETIPYKALFHYYTYI